MLVSVTGSTPVTRLLSCTPVQSSTLPPAMQVPQPAHNPAVSLSHSAAGGRAQDSRGHGFRSSQGGCTLQLQCRQLCKCFAAFVDPGGGLAVGVPARPHQGLDPPGGELQLQNDPAADRVLGRAAGLPVRRAAGPGGAWLAVPLNKKIPFALCQRPLLLLTDSIFPFRNSAQLGTRHTTQTSWTR